MNGYFNQLCEAEKQCLRSVDILFNSVPTTENLEVDHINEKIGKLWAMLPKLRVRDVIYNDLLLQYQYFNTKQKREQVTEEEKQ